MNFRNNKNQSGQTLIETVVAVFILVMGITASLGLANYSLNATGNIRKQIIAMGLAREGIEAVKNMRDTNWLYTTLSSDCYNFYSSDSTGFCYKGWINPAASGQSGYNISPGTYSLKSDTNSTGLGYWTLTSQASNFGLNYDSSSNPQHGLYSAWSGPNDQNATSDYSRKITISAESSVAPFNKADIGPRLLVTSQVWWKDKKCPFSADAPSSQLCVVKIQTYLTNWKDY